VHSSLTHALALLINNEIRTCIDDCSLIFQLQRFFSIIENLRGNPGFERKPDQADAGPVSCLACHKKEELLSFYKYELNKSNEQISWSLKNAVNMCRLMRSLQLKYGIKDTPSDDKELMRSSEKELIEIFCSVFEIDESDLREAFKLEETLVEG
jgi:hypothetical protein